MNVLTSEALQGLATVMDTLLPAALRSSLLILPIHSAPTGLGGFVGLNDAPAGEIVGRRLRASMLLTLQAADAAQLGSAVTSAVNTVLALDRATLLAQGILRLTFDSLGPEISRPGSSDLHRELSFHVLYEFLKKPTASEGIIETIPITMAVGTPDLTVRVLARILFTADPLGLFEVIDDPLATQGTASQWQYNTAEARVEQQATIRGGPDDSSVTKPGTYLVLRAEPVRPAVQDFTLKATVRSDGGGGIGLVCRWQDVNNFYFFLLDQQLNFRMLGKKVAGTFQALDVAASDTTRSYQPDAFHGLRMTAKGSTLRAYLDDALILEGEDASLAGPGRVGLVCRNNDQAAFYNIDLVQG